MAARDQEVAPGRIIACFLPGTPAPAAEIAELARQARAELLALFIEDAALLRFAALPFAAEVGFPSAALRSVDPASLQRALRAQAQALRAVLALALAPSAHAWSFRVARASPESAVETVLAEGYAPSLLLPPGSDPRAQRRVLRRSELVLAQLRELLAGRRPVLVLPE